MNEQLVPLTPHEEILQAIKELSDRLNSLELLVCRQIDEDLALFKLITERTEPRVRGRR